MKIKFNHKNVVIILLLATFFVSCKISEDEEDLNTQTLTIPNTTLSIDFDNRNLTLPTAYISWNNATGVDDIKYNIYYSKSDNINTLGGITKYGIEITSNSSPIYQSPSVSSNNQKVEIKGLTDGEVIYINIVASSIKNTQELSYTSVKCYYRKINNNLILDSGEEYDFIVDGYPIIESDNKVSFYTDFSNSKDLYIGMMNPSESYDDDFYIENILSLNTKPYPGVIPVKDVNSLENISLDTHNRSLMVTNMVQAPYMSIYSGSREPIFNEIPGTTTKNFSSGDDSHQSTLRYSSTVSTEFGNKNLKIWVEDQSWGESGTDANLTEDMITQLAIKFLKTGSNNDIYDWVTNVYGEEWGTHNYIDLIPESNEINILLADLFHDKQTDGGVIGYFWAKDNFTKTSESTSNERIMFYIDSIFFSQADDTEWNITDTQPMEIVSTLGHEFQHMIGFYQSSVIRGLTINTWVTELLSLATEDFLAEKLNINGPRGYKTADGKASELDNIENGRIPLYNLYMETPRFTWLPSDADGNGMPYVLRSYSYNYALGAYLTRNYGGPELLKHIMYQVEDIEDLEDLLSDNPVTNIKDNIYEMNLIPEFQISVLLSDKIVLEDKYKFNKSGWFTYNINGVDYKLPSINFYNYSVKPYTFTEEELFSLFNGTIPANSLITAKIPNVLGSNEIIFNSGNNSSSPSIFMLGR